MSNIDENTDYDRDITSSLFKFNENDKNELKIKMYEQLTLEWDTLYEIRPNLCPYKNSEEDINTDWQNVESKENFGLSTKKIDIINDFRKINNDQDGLLNNISSTLFNPFASNVIKSCYVKDTLLNKTDINDFYRIEKDSKSNLRYLISKKNGNRTYIAKTSNIYNFDEYDKDAIKEKYYPIIHEALFRMEVVNRAKYFLPNFEYTYGIINCTLKNNSFCKDKADKNPENFLTPKNSPVLLIDYLESTITLRDYINEFCNSNKKINYSEKIKNICIQIVNALNILKSISEIYTNFNLNLDNIKIQKYSSPIVIPIYIFEKSNENNKVKQIKYIISDTIVYITDFSRSTFFSRESFYCNLNKGFKISIDNTNNVNTDEFVENYFTFVDYELYTRLNNNDNNYIDKIKSENNSCDIIKIFSEITNEIYSYKKTLLNNYINSPSNFNFKNENDKLIVDIIKWMSYYFYIFSSVKNVTVSNNKYKDDKYTKSDINVFFKSIIFDLSKTNKKGYDHLLRCKYNSNSIYYNDILKLFVESVEQNPRFDSYIFDESSDELKKHPMFICINDLCKLTPNKIFYDVVNNKNVNYNKFIPVTKSHVNIFYSNLKTVLNNKFKKVNLLIKYRNNNNINLENISPLTPYIWNNYEKKHDNKIFVQILFLEKNSYFETNIIKNIKLKSIIKYIYEQKIEPEFKNDNLFFDLFLTFTNEKEEKIIIKIENIINKLINDEFEESENYDINENTILKLVQIDN